MIDDFNKKEGREKKEFFGACRSTEKSKKNGWDCLV